MARMLVRMSAVTQILRRIEQGETSAAEELLPRVYDELRRLASHRMSQEAPGQTIQATALVHEAWLRLVDVDEVQQWDSRAHFFAAAAEAMRRILVDRARNRQRLKRGGHLQRRELEEAVLAAPQVQEDLVALDEALLRLESVDSQAAAVVKLRYFAGLSLAESAQAVGVSPRTADRLWAYARAWLSQEISDSEEEIAKEQE